MIDIAKIYCVFINHGINKNLKLFCRAGVAFGACLFVIVSSCSCYHTNSCYFFIHSSKLQWKGWLRYVYVFLSTGSNVGGVSHVTYS